MRSLGFLIVAISIFLLVAAARDELRGITSARGPSRFSPRYTVSQAAEPKHFREVMGYKWLWASLTGAGGLVVLGICRRAEHTDPFSPDLGR